MGLGKMNAFIKIAKTHMERDADNAMRPVDEVQAEIRAYREFQRGTERWANLAAFSAATVMFRFRVIPGLVVTPDLCVLCGGTRYRIISAEDVRGRGMYVEVLAGAYDPTIF